QVRVCERRMRRVSLCLADGEVVCETGRVLPRLNGRRGIRVVPEVIELVESRRAERCRIDEVRAGADRSVRDDLVQVESWCRARPETYRFVDDAFGPMPVYDRGYKRAEVPPAAIRRRCRRADELRAVDDL